MPGPQWRAAESVEARELGFRVLLRSSCRVWDSFRVQGLGFKVLKAYLFLIAFASVKTEARAWDDAGLRVWGLGFRFEYQVPRRPTLVTPKHLRWV